MDLIFKDLRKFSHVFEERDVASSVSLGISWMQN